MKLDFINTYIFLCNNFSFMFFRLTPFYILNHAFIDNTALSTFLPAVENQRQNIFLLLLNNFDAYFWYVKLKMPDLLHSKLVFLKSNLLT